MVGGFDQLFDCLRVGCDRVFLLRPFLILMTFIQRGQDLGLEIRGQGGSEGRLTISGVDDV